MYVVVDVVVNGVRVYFILKFRQLLSLYINQNARRDHYVGREKIGDINKCVGY